MGQDPDAIREDIAQTRAKMNETVEAIGYKADVPSRAKEAVSEKVDSVKSKVSDTATRAREAVVGTASRAGDTVSGTASRVGDATPSRGEVRQTTRRAAGLAKENPLGLAIGAAAVGFLAGLAVPLTRVQDERLGLVTDEVRDKVKGTVADLMSESFALADQSMTVDQALRKLTEGHVLVVLDPHTRPYGIFTRGMLENAKRTSPLADLRDECAMPTITSGEAAISTLLVGMASDPAIRWHIVMAGRRIVGVVGPYTLLARLEAAWQAGRPWASERLLAAFQASRGAFGPAGGLFGPPVSETPNLCYCCQQNPPHCVGPEAIKHKTPSGRALCPDCGSLTTVKNPCV